MKTKIIISVAYFTDSFEKIELDSLPFIPRKGDAFFLSEEKYPSQVAFLERITERTGCFSRVAHVWYTLSDNLLEIDITLHCEPHDY